MSDPFDQFDDFLNDNDSSWQEEHHKSQPFATKHLSEFAVFQQINWTIKNVIPQKGLVVMYGAPGSGKSFAALDMAMKISQTKTIHSSWGEHKVKNGRVVYVCAEAPNGFKNRIITYMLHYDFQFSELENFVIIDEAPNLISAIDVDRIISQIGTADIIYFDTLACVMPGGDENAAKDMSLVISNCKKIIQATNATVVLIGHPGKDLDKGHRGWSGILGAVDTEIKVEALGTAHTLTITKQKEGQSGKQYGFTLPVYQLGTDNDGDPITSCYFEPSEVLVTQKSKEEKLGIIQKLILDCLKQMPENPVMLEDLIVYAIKSIPQDSQKVDRRRDRIIQSISILQNKDVISTTNNLIYKN